MTQNKAATETTRKRDGLSFKEFMRVLSSLSSDALGRSDGKVAFSISALAVGMAMTMTILAITLSPPLALAGGSVFGVFGSAAVWHCCKLHKEIKEERKKNSLFDRNFRKAANAFKNIARKNWRYKLAGVAAFAVGIGVSVVTTGLAWAGLPVLAAGAAGLAVANKGDRSNTYAGIRDARAKRVIPEAAKYNFNYTANLDNSFNHAAVGSPDANTQSAPATAPADKPRI